MMGSTKRSKKIFFWVTDVHIFTFPRTIDTFPKRVYSMLKYTRGSYWTKIFGKYILYPQDPLSKITVCLKINKDEIFSKRNFLLIMLMDKDKPRLIFHLNGKFY